MYMGMQGYTYLSYEQHTLYMYKSCIRSFHGKFELHMSEQDLPEWGQGQVLYQWDQCQSSAE